MKFLLGVNYWDSAHGTDMWKYYDEEVIREDMKSLANIGVKYLRVFPNWRDFQPIQRLYAWRMKPMECVTLDDQPLEDATGVDKGQIENFRNFCGICQEYGIELIVSILTGWMSGRLFVPPALNGKNVITDPEALVWTDRFIRGFVSRVKDIPNIIMWDLGNECNCLAPADNKYQTYVWTAFVRNAIKAADPTRLISSGMHGLDGYEVGLWPISDQGEITDMMTTHPYISPTINNDYDAGNQMRSTIFPTAQSMYYQDLGKKPVMMQEQNGTTETTTNREMATDFMRANIYSCLAHNITGYFWWCAHEHTHLDKPPYTWSMMERSLGILDEDRKPKPIGNEMKKMSEIIEALPFEELPQHQIDAVCVLTDNESRWDNGSVAFVLAKQAGLDVKFCQGDESGVYPSEAPMYIVPGVWKWAIMYKHTWEFLKSKVRDDGASMLVTYDGGSLIEMAEVFGLKPHGNIRSNATHVAEFGFGKLEYSVNQELKLESVGAKVLATNEEGNIVFTEHNYGKGKVFFLNMPLERKLSRQAGVFNQTDWYKIYQKAGEDVIKNRLVVSENPQIGVTIHKESDDRYIICAINYSDETQDTCLRVQDGWGLSEVHGSLKQLGKCEGAFYYATKSN